MSTGSCGVGRGYCAGGGGGLSVTYTIYRQVLWLLLPTLLAKMYYASRVAFVAVTLLWVTLDR